MITYIDRVRRGTFFLMPLVLNEPIFSKKYHQTRAVECLKKIKTFIVKIATQTLSIHQVDKILFLDFFNFFLTLWHFKYQIMIFKATEAFIKIHISVHILSVVNDWLVYMF